MVRFKVEAHTLLMAIMSSFHPTMVRFKEAKATKSSAWDRCFHPTMVRFKGEVAGPGPVRLRQVSIPLWCDLKYIAG